MNMVSKSVQQMIRRIDVWAGSNQSRKIAIELLKDRLQAESVDHACLRCARAVWGVNWAPGRGGVSDFSIVLLACQVHPALSQAGGEGLIGLISPNERGPFFCSCEIAEEFHHEF